jgi:glutamate-ammonia-ligase adenylyltransferase
MLDEKLQKLIQDLPDADAAERFFIQLSENLPLEAKKLKKDGGLLSDVLSLASFSPLLASTLLQNPTYFAWLKKQKTSQKVRQKEEILESLARFHLINSELGTNILLARFRRRELLRIYLHDIRNLGTIAEVTEEISNLADAILEYALRIAIQEKNNYYGTPFETDENNRAKPSSICIVALGKLGSKELNYSSDIDLLFLYSSEGKTSGQGAKDSITNREYFVKLTQLVSKLVGGQGGEGAAYRVDLRLRPNGRVGTAAISLKDAVNYYQKTARTWERQVLIRSRASAGNAEIFNEFFESVKSKVFSKEETLENALRNVRLSKEQINVEKNNDKGFNVKLGKGGIREIEFIAQALQLAYGGNDEWIRASHTLISLDRLADRKLFTENELTQLFKAYSFLRRVEHRLQMKNGLQTHLVPEDSEKRLTFAKKMNFSATVDFNDALEFHTRNVSKIFTRIFGESTYKSPIKTEEVGDSIKQIVADEIFQEHIANSEELLDETKSSMAYKQIISSLEKSEFAGKLKKEKRDSLKHFCKISPHFAEMIAANPMLVKHLPLKSDEFLEKNFKERLLDLVGKEKYSFSEKLSILRQTWSACLLEIVSFDVFEKLTRIQTKSLQTKLAEASLETALFITKTELERHFKIEFENFPLAILGLGKLGGGGMDYGSDLDLVLIYDEVSSLKSRPHGLGDLDLELGTFYARAVEIFVTTLSSLTRDGLLYRVDLRLRPDGKNGATSSSKSSFLSYLETRSAIWEWLAYVKLRGVAGDLELAKSTEFEARKIIHHNALKTSKKELQAETLRVRERLENEKSSGRTGKIIDIKFSEGGMLDVYFAMRFLQLRDNVPDDSENRSTTKMLVKLRENNSLNEEDFQYLLNGYLFLSQLDHNLRLIIGRSTLLPVANQKALQTITQRLELDSLAELHEKLTFHRLHIRSSFENILKN